MARKKQWDEELDGEDDAGFLGGDNLPAPGMSKGGMMVDFAKESGLLLEEFQAVQEDDTDKTTTTSDLKTLNNFLGCIHGSLPYIRTIEGLCKASDTAVKLIEARRKVKKLAYGETAKSKGTFDVLE